MQPDFPEETLDYGCVSEDESPEEQGEFEGDTDLPYPPSVSSESPHQMVVSSALLSSVDQKVATASRQVTCTNHLATSAAPWQKPGLPLIHLWIGRTRVRKNTETDRF